MKIIDHFFRAISKPIGLYSLLILLVVMCYAQYVRKFENSKRDVKIPTPKVMTQKTTLTKKNPTVIDINGSYECKTASTAAYMKNKKVRIINNTLNQTDHFLFDGDCIFSWKISSSTGYKSCGFGQYLSIYEMFGGAIDLESVLPYINSFQKSLGLNSGQTFKTPNASAISKSCIKKEIIDSSIFNLPKNISFTEIKK